MWHQGLTEKLFSCGRRNQTVCRRRSKQAAALLLPRSGTAEAIEFHHLALFVTRYKFPPRNFWEKIHFFSWKKCVTKALFVIPPRRQHNIFSTRAKYKYANICVRAGRNFLLIPSPTYALGTPLHKLFNASLGGFAATAGVKVPVSHQRPPSRF